MEIVEKMNTYKVNSTNGVNVRTQPSTSSAKSGNAIPQGWQVQGDAPYNGWVSITAYRRTDADAWQSRNGYCSADYLTLTSSTSTASTSAASTSTATAASESTASAGEADNALTTTAAEQTSGGKAGKIIAWGVAIAAVLGIGYFLLKSKKSNSNKPKHTKK